MNKKVADLYVADASIFQRAYKQYCYFGKLILGYSADWVFDMQDGRITRVGKGGTDTFNMAGISYWKKKDATHIREAIEKAYNTAGHEKLFWDEIVNQELPKLNVTVEEITVDSIIEIDTLEELREIDRSYRGAE